MSRDRATALQPGRQREALSLKKKKFIQDPYPGDRGPFPPRSPQASSTQYPEKTTHFFHPLLPHLYFQHPFMSPAST